VKRLAEITQRFAGKHQAAPLPGRRCGRIRHRAPTPRHDLAARRRPGYFFNIIHARNAVDALRVFIDVAEGFDAAVILRLVDARQQTTVVPGNEATWDGQGYLSYKDTSGYVLTDTIVVVEVNLFSVPSGKLLWSGSSETLNPANARALAVEVARAAAAELRTQRLIQ